MRLSRNFTLNEFKCPCCEADVEDVSMKLVSKLQLLRDKFKMPINITSGYRCERHNKAVGGSKRSQHLKGRAVDIDVSHYSAHDLHRLIRLIYASGSFSGVGIGGGKLHVDVRDDVDVTWIY